VPERLGKKYFCWPILVPVFRSLAQKAVRITRTNSEHI